MENRFVGGLATPLSEISSQQGQPAELFDDEAFARAFDEAAQAEQMDVSQDSKQEYEATFGQNGMLNETAERFMSEEVDEGVIVNQEPIGADTIHGPHFSEAFEEQDPDALSKTAGKLLHSVENNQSSKFQNSQFLTLMRQFRDRQALVEGDKIVDTSKRDIDMKTEVVKQPNDQEALKVAWSLIVPSYIR